MPHDAVQTPGVLLPFRCVAVQRILFRAIRNVLVNARVALPLLKQELAVRFGKIKRDVLEPQDSALLQLLATPMGAVTALGGIAPATASSEICHLHHWINANGVGGCFN